MTSSEVGPVAGKTQCVRCAKDIQIDSRLIPASVLIICTACEKITRNNGDNTKWPTQVQTAKSSKERQQPMTSRSDDEPQRPPLQQKPQLDNQLPEHSTKEVDPTLKQPQPQPMPLHQRNQQNDLCDTSQKTSEVGVKPKVKK